MTTSLTAKMLLALVLVTTVMVGCGRKTDLDVPGAAVIPRAKAGETAAPESAKPPVEDRRFILDGLL